MKSLPTCKNGHQYYKVSECLVCPVCEHQRKLAPDFLSFLSAPARRALDSKGITTLKQLSELSKNEVLALHGIGKSSLPYLEDAMQREGLRFFNSENEHIN